MSALAENLIKRISDGLEEYSRAERAVAEVVLDEPERIIHTSLANLARLAEVSEPTVLRFCRSSGSDGYPDFKVKLAQALASYFPFADLPVQPDDVIGAYASKVIEATLDAVLRVRSSLALEVAQQAVSLLTSATKIEFWGVGASGIVAIDAHHKFFRLSSSCVAYADSHMQYMSAITLAPGDVVVAISHTGRTRELLASVELARASGASVIAITAEDSPLAGLADLLLAVDVREDTELYTPMTSRIAHLVVIDILALGVALAGSASSAERLRRIKDQLRHKRVPIGQQ